MNYIKLTSDGEVDVYPYGVRQLQKDNPNTSFPSPITDEDLAEWNVFPVTPVDAPKVDHTKTVAEGTPEFVNGSFQQVWNVTDASAEEIEARSQAKAVEIRTERNRLISGCDWTQLPDAPVDAANWKLYRQALRDIPEQQGFPWNVNWPLAPF